ncbi:MAG: D-alanyl-D-alanine carboxypeptidase, partial [Clostridiaceae bacterium]|nr:D-alanyl-D-alanine carboxypeptidase [Clostridiaceae bacterium]
GHYSTAYDLALITRYALENRVFSEIVATKEITISKRSLHNTNEMLSMYPGADGVKTGYTGKAGRCLVTSATREEFRIISVVLNCSSRYMRAKSSKEILDYAFNNYKMHVLLEPGEIIGELPVIKGLDENVHVGTSEKIVYPLRQDEAERLERKILLPESLNAPVFGGTDVGYIKFVLDGNVLAESKLKAWKDVARKDFRYYLDNIIMQWLKLVKHSSQ